MDNRYSYGPPLYDSEDSDEYEGFMFSDDNIKRSRLVVSAVNPVCKSDIDDILDGDLEALKRKLNDPKFHINECVAGGDTLLHHACKCRHVSIVRCLLENDAAVDFLSDSRTALMVACDNMQPSPEIDEIVKLLLKHGANVNLCNKYGATAFSMACKNGHIDAVRRMINDVNINLNDNFDATPLFNAVENNHTEIVKLLIENGADITLPNRKGYTARQAAEFHGFYDLLQYFPSEPESFIVPTTHITYNTLRDCVPRLFLKSDCPEYFQEIYRILQANNMSKFIEFFAKENVSFLEFLSMDDKRFEEIGIQMPFFRNKLQLLLLEYHLSHWDSDSLERTRSYQEQNLYGVLMLAGTHLMRLVIIQGALRYLQLNLKTERFGGLESTRIQIFRNNLAGYRKSLQNIKNTAKYVASYCPTRNPLFIDYDEYVAKKRRRIYFKYSVAIGLSVFAVYLNLKKIF